MFEGFGIDYLLGSALFGVLNLFTLYATLLVVAIVWAGLLWIFKEGPVSFRDFKPVLVLSILGLVAITLVAPSMVVTPRVIIQTDENEALLEYQRDREEPVIVTPEPRIEMLDGFRPLGE